MSEVYYRYDPDAPRVKVFRCYVFKLGWWALFNLGIHLDWTQPNFELHLPLCVFKLGWYSEPKMEEA